MNYKKIQGAVVGFCLIFCLQEPVLAKVSVTKPVPSLELVLTATVKKLTSPKMLAFNKFLELKPWITVEMFITSDRANLISDSIDEERGLRQKAPRQAHASLVQQEKEAIKNFLKNLPEKEGIKQSLKYVLIPVKDFFKTVKNNGNLIKPLLEECLGTSGSMLAKFFDAKDDNLFFDQELTTKDLLQKICKEYITFFSSIEVSITPLAKERYLAEREIYLTKLEKLLQEKKEKNIKDRENKKNSPMPLVG